MSGLPIAAIYSSPLERALETAEPVAERLGLDIRAREPLLELDFGEWSGLSLAELEGMQGWKLFNSYRTGTRPPGGELMIEAQGRMVGEIERLNASHGGALLAVVGHGDPLKTVICHYAGVPLELLQRIEISPASVSVLSLSIWGARISCVNETGEIVLA